MNESTIRPGNRVTRGLSEHLHQDRICNCASVLPYLGAVLAALGLVCSIRPAFELLAMVAHAVTR